MRTNFVKSTNLTLRKKLSSGGLRVVLLVLLLVLSVGSAWAGGTSYYYYYAKVTAQTASESTGRGYVYASTSAASTASATTASSNATGQDPNSGSGGGAVTFYLYANPVDGYCFDGWSTSSTRPGSFSDTEASWQTTFNAATTASSKVTSKPSGEANKTGNTDSSDEYYTGTQNYNEYAYFSPVQVTAIDHATMTINPTDPRTTCEDYADNFAFTTSGADAMADFVDSEVKQTSKTGNGTFTITTTPDFGNNKVKAAWQFKGSGTYGGTTNPRNRQNSVTYKLTSKGDAASNKTCTITANFPNLSMSGEDVEVYTTYVAAEPSTGTAVITVNYADDANDFTTAPASVALSNIVGDAGTWSLGTITMSATDYATGVATISIPYTFTPAGGGKTGPVTADYVLTANTAAGGASFTLHFTAEVTKPETYEASVTIGGTTTKYEYLLGTGGALEAANGATGATLKLLKDVEVNEAVVIRKAMTFDLNSFTLTSSLSSIATKAIEITNGVSVTLCTSRAGGKIVASGNYNGRLSGVEVTSGLLTYNSGSIDISNANTGTTEANRYAVGVYLAAGGMIMTNGSITASRTGASGNYVYGVFCAAGTAVDITGGTITATNTNGGYAYGIFLRGQSPLNGITITATAKDHAYGVWTDSGEVVVEGGSYTATTTATTHARAFLCRGEVNILGGSFTATTATDKAAAVYTYGGTTTIGGGSYIANAANTAYGIEMYTSGDVVKVNGGTFTATASTSNAAGVWVNNGTSLTTTTGTFTATAEGAGTDIRAYGAYVVAGGSADIKGSTFRGVTTGATTAKATTNCNNVSGGVYYGAYGICNHGTLSIANSALYGMSAKVYGYGLYTTFGATVSNSTITATAGTDRSVALYPNGSGKTITLTDCTVTGSSEGTYSYAVYSLGGILNATNTNFTGETKQTGVSAAAASYSRGIYGNASSTISLTGGTVTAKGSASYSQTAYAFYVAGPGTIEGTTVVTENVNSGHALLAEGSSARLTVINGHFKGVTASLNVSSSPTVSLRGGFYSHNTNITAARMPAGYQVFSVPDGSVEKSNGYNYSIGTPDNPGYAVCKNVQRNKEYNTLAEALQEVTANQVIVMTADYTLPAGNYTLPANATLLVPRKDVNTVQEHPERIYNSYTSPTCNRKLTFANGVRFDVYGTIQTGGKQSAKGQLPGYNGTPTESYGWLYLDGDSKITLESGSKLYAWGYVTGSGEIDAKRGSTVYEFIQIRDYRGGTCTSNMSGAFPFNQFYIQNVESAITFHPGSKEICDGTVNTRLGAADFNDVAFIGINNTGSLFMMADEDTSEDTWVRKSYNAVEDKQVYELNSSVNLGSITVYGKNSANYVLPLPNNMHIHLLSGEMHIKENTEVLPGAILEIDKEATAYIDANKSLYIFDLDEWVPFAANVHTYPLEYSPSWAGNGKTCPRSKKITVDASINVHGTFVANGNLYTTAGGANIFSTNEDAGTILFGKAAPSSTTVRVNNTTNASSNTEQTANPAWLKNADTSNPWSYTSGTASGKSWVYYEDKWQCWTPEGCFYLDAEDYPYAKPAAYVKLQSDENKDAIEDANHLYHDAETEVRAFLVDGDCVWWEVEPIPYDGNKYKCVNPDRNGKYKYYEYDSGWQEAVVTITWKNGSTTLDTYGNSLYGSRPKYLSATPTKTAGTYVQYSWDGWLTEADKSHETDIAPVDNSWRVLDNNEMPVATTAATYYAHYTVNPKQYYIKFYSENGSVILQQSAQNAATPEAPSVGLRPVYGGTTPTKDPTTAKEYIFYGWSTAANGGGTKYAADNLPVLTAVSNYYACFTEQTREYTISFVNYNGDVLKTGKVAYGATPTAPTGAYAPTRANDAFWSYDFSGWDKEIRAVDGDETYTAQYTRTALVPKYTIRFLNWDGTQLYRTTVEEGQTPVYAGVTPTREEYGYTYTFTGWGTITAATANKDYTAQYDVVADQFYITFLDEDGRQRERKLVDYNTMPTYTGSALSKDPTTEETFVFDHWTPALAKVTGEATYTAVYAASPRKYTITFWNYNHTSQLQSTEVAYGTTPTYSGGTPTKPKDTYSYVFSDWVPAITAVTGDQSYIPAFNQTALGQTITFLNSDGTALYEQDIPTDQPTVYNGPTPTKAADATYVYVHDGWSSSKGGAKLESLPTVSGPATYYAHYSTTPTVASMTVGGTTTYYATLSEPLALAGERTNATVKVLVNISGIAASMTYTSTIASNTCTLDLNGKTVTGTANKLLDINTVGTFTITSSAANGVLKMTGTPSNACYYNVYLSKGTLVLNSANATLAVDNATAYSGENYALCVLYTATGTTFTMNNGTISARVDRRAYGIESHGTTNINNGTITCQTIRYAYPYGIQVKEGTTTISNGAISATAGTTYAYSVLQTGGELRVTGGALTSSAPTTSNASYYNSAIRIDAGTAIVSGGTLSAEVTGTSNSKNAYGIYSNGTLTVSNCSVSASVQTSGAYSVYVAGGSTTIKSGKYKATAPSAVAGVYKAAGTLSIEAGYFVQETNLAANLAAGRGVFTLTSGAEYTEGYRRKVAEAVTVTWNATANGGTCTPASSRIEKGTAIGTLPTPTKTDWTFTGWFTASTGGTQITASTVVNNDIGYFAQFTPNAHTYKYRTSAGVWTSETLTIATQPASVPNWEDAEYRYSFDSWSRTGATESTAQYSKVDKIYGSELDVVDWLDLNTVVLNMNGYSSATAKQGWKIRANGSTYTTANRDDASVNPAKDRTMKIDLTGAGLAADGKVVIEALGSEDAIESRRFYAVPHIYNSSATLSDNKATSNIYVRANATLTVGEGTTVGNVYVSPNARLVINDGVTLIADTIFLRTTPWASAELAFNGTGTLNGKVCYTRIIASQDYNQFGLPLSCDVADVRLSNGTKPKYNTGWKLRYYDENLRATQGTGSTIDNWATLAESGTITAGVGYEMYSASKYYREFYFPVDYTTATNIVSVERTIDDKLDPTHVGWNFLVSPKLSSYTVESTDPATEMKLNWLLPGNGGYDQVLATERPIRPAIPFAFQATDDGKDKLVFEADNTLAYKVPQRRAAYDEAIQTEWICLDVKDVTDAGDQTSLFVHPDRFESTYKTGIDVAKQSFEASRALIYSSHVYGEMAFAGVADSLLEQGVALTVYSPSAQELMISMRENEWLNRMAYVWLVDKETGMRVDLLESDYAFRVHEGTTDGRLYIQGVFRTPQVFTNLEQISSANESEKARKVIIDNKMYILINNRIYDATGKLVK